MDESGIDSRIYREWARSKRGVKVFSDITGKRSARTTLIAARVENRIIAPFRYQGYTDSRVFEAYLEQVLVPELRKGQVVILDNASFHKSTKAKELIENAGCKIIFLPPYSPDLNPIEKSWAHIKAKIKKFKNKFDNIEQIIDYVL